MMTKTKDKWEKRKIKKSIYPCFGCGKSRKECICKELREKYG